MRILIVFATAFALCTAANAGAKSAKACVQVAQLQTPLRPLGLATNRPAAAIDHLSVCHQERGRIEASLLGLRNQIAAAQAQLSQNQGLTFRCVDHTTSANNRGEIEYCDPNACNDQTGRCFNEVHSSDECSPAAPYDDATRTCTVPSRNQGGGNSGW